MRTMSGNSKYGRALIEGYGSYFASQDGFKGMSFPLIYPGIDGGGLLSATFLYSTKVYLEDPTPFSNVSFYLATSGTAATTGQCGIGVWNAAGTLLAQATPSVALTALTGSTGLKTVAMVNESGQVVPGGASGVWVHIGMLWNGTGTTPNVARCVQGGSLVNLNLSSSTYRTGYSAPYTAMPTTRPTLLNPGSSLNWIGVS